VLALFAPRLSWERDARASPRDARRYLLSNTDQALFEWTSRTGEPD